MEIIEYVCLIDNSTILEKFFSQNIKYLRTRKHLTLVELAALLNVSKSAISDYENGKSIPSVHVVDKIAIYFDVNVDALMNLIIDEKIIADLKYGSQATKPENRDFVNELLRQKIQALEMQNQLLHQLVASKEAENATLRLQIKLVN